MSDRLGERIRARREALGMQQIDLADAIGVRPHSMWRYEAGKSRPRAEMLDKIADALQTTSKALLHGEEDELEEPDRHIDVSQLSDEDLAIEGLRRDEMRNGRMLMADEEERLREEFRSTQLSIGVMSTEDAHRYLSVTLRKIRSGQEEDYSRPSTPARDRLLGRRPRK